MLDFLAAVMWKHGDSEPGWDERARPLMRLAGLRSDDQAVTIGKALVRSWVTGGMGPQGRDDIRRQVADRDLLALAGTLTLTVHAIDRQPAATAPNVELDFTGLFDGDDPLPAGSSKTRRTGKPSSSRGSRRLPGNWRPTGLAEST